MKIVILASAEGDLNALQSYITHEFSALVWRKTYQTLKDTIIDTRRDLPSFLLRRLVR